MNGTLVAHIGQGWREPIVPGTPVAEKISIANYQYAIGNEAKAPDLEELAAQIEFRGRQGDCQRRQAPAREEKKKSKRLTRFQSGPRAPFCCPPRCRPLSRM